MEKISRISYLCENDGNGWFMGNTEVPGRQSDGDQKANDDLHIWLAGFPHQSVIFPPSSTTEASTTIIQLLDKFWRATTNSDDDRKRQARLRIPKVQLQSR